MLCYQINYSISGFSAANNHISAKHYITNLSKHFRWQQVRFSYALVLGNILKLKHKIRWHNGNQILLSKSDCWKPSSSNGSATLPHICNHQCNIHLIDLWVAEFILGLFKILRPIFNQILQFHCIIRLFQDIICRLQRDCIVTKICRMMWFSLKNFSLTTKF